MNCLIRSVTFLVCIFWLDSALSQPLDQGQGFAYHDQVDTDVSLPQQSPPTEPLSILASNLLIAESQENELFIARALVLQSPDWSNVLSAEIPEHEGVEIVGLIVDEHYATSTHTVYIVYAFANHDQPHDFEVQLNIGHITPEGLGVETKLYFPEANLLPANIIENFLEQNCISNTIWFPWTFFDTCTGGIKTGNTLNPNSDYEVSHGTLSFESGPQAGCHISSTTTSPLSTVLSLFSFMIFLVYLRGFGRQHNKLTS